MQFDIDKYYLEQQKRMEADQDSDDAEAYVAAFKRVRAATNFASSQAPSESTSTTPSVHGREPEPTDEMSLSKRKQPEEPQSCDPESKKKRSSLDGPPSGSASTTISGGTAKSPKLAPTLPPVQPHVDNSIANISRDTICEFDDTLSSPSVVPDQPSRSSKVQKSETKQQRHVSPSRPIQGASKIPPQNVKAKDKAQDSNTNNQAPPPLVFHETEPVVTKFPRIDLAAVAGHSNAKKTSSSLKAQAQPLKQASNAKKRAHTEDVPDVATASSSKVKLDPSDVKGKKKASSNAVPDAAAAATTSAPTPNVLFPSVDRKQKGRSKTPAADTVGTNATTSSRSLQKQSTALVGGKSKSILSFRNANGAKSTLPSMSPEEFARMLLADPPRAGPGDCQCLEGKVFFIVGGERQFVSERTRGQMRYILKHGGMFTPTYDPELITHIITEAGEEKTRRTLGIRNIKDIPDHIPTVKWNYVLSCRPGTSLSKMEFMHASFASRLEAGHDWKAENGKGRSKKKSNEDVSNRPGASTKNNASANATNAVGTAGATTRKSDEDGEVSRIEEFTPERPKRHVGSAAAAMPPPPFLEPAAPLSSLEAPTAADETILDPSFSHQILTPPSSPIVAASSLSSNKRALPSSAPTTPEKNPKKRRRKDVDENKNKNENVRAEDKKKRGSHSGDPLAEFYVQARAEKDADSEYDDKEAVPGEEDRTSDFVEEGEAGFSRSASIQGRDDDSETDTDQDDDNDENNNNRSGRAGAKKLWVPAKRGFTCDNPQLQRTDGICPNQDVIEKLSELRDLHKAKPTEEDQWRTFSYDKCIRALKNYPYRIQSLSEARSIRGIGKKTAIKVMEIIRTGNLARIDHERTEDVEVTKIFQGIYGVGRKISYQWYMAGLRTLDDVRDRKGGLFLSPPQEIGLEFYDDLQKRIPRREVQTIYESIKAMALKIDPGLFIEIMGSYRRGKADCGDIDILISRPPFDGKTHKGILRKLLPILHGANIVTEDLHVPHNYEDLENVYRGLCVLPSSSANSNRIGKEKAHPVAGIRRRIDILAVPWENRGAALLYYTGDDIFNRAMRLKASVMGYSLNQRGLYQGVVRDPRNRMNKLCKGTRIAGETEEEIFEILGIPWQEPHERVRGQ